MSSGISLHGIVKQSSSFSSQALGSSPCFSRWSLRAWVLMYDTAGPADLVRRWLGGGPGRELSRVSSALLSFPSLGSSAYTYSSILSAVSATPVMALNPNCVADFVIGNPNVERSKMNITACPLEKIFHSLDVGMLKSVEDQYVFGIGAMRHLCIGSHCITSQEKLEQEDIAEAESTETKEENGSSQKAEENVNQNATESTAFADTSVPRQRRFLFRGSMMLCPDGLDLQMMQRHLELNDVGMLLGDSGYPLRHYLMTPVLRPLGRQQTAYNVAHARGRVVVELLKSRF
ncbi:hypothetical protein MAR_009390, partial [Mya arenaria]